MKKNVFYYCLLLLFLVSFGCSKSEELEIEDPQGEIHLKSAGDLVYDVLGQGYDITGMKDDYSSIRQPVIDINKFASEQPSRIFKDYPSSEDYQSTFGFNSANYISDIKVDTKTNATVNPFSGSITSNFSNYQSYSSQYVFATIDDVVRHARIYLSADNSMLMNYLTAPFVTNLQTKSASVIVQMYGTHVLLDITTGGKLRSIYKSEVISGDRKATVTAGAVFTVEKLFGKSTNISYVSSLVSNNIDATLSYQTRGGTVSPANGSIEIKNGIPTTPPLNVNVWANSVHSNTIGSATFIYADYSAAIPIYELVSDPVKKAQLQTEVENYINSKKLDMRSPFFRYYYSNNGHVFITDRSELEGTIWRYEGIACYLYDHKEPNTVRLYRYHNTGSLDHFYTINYNTLQEGTGNWHLENTYYYYVYNYQALGTVPLYRYYNPGNSKHHYTIDKYELGTLSGTGANKGFTYEGIECYVFPK